MENITRFTMPRLTLFYTLCASMTTAAVLTSLLNFLCSFTFDTRWLTPEPWQVLPLQKGAMTAEELHCEVAGLSNTVRDDHRSKVTSGDKAAANKVDVSARETTRKATWPREITVYGYERDEDEGEEREMKTAPKDGGPGIGSSRGPEQTRQVNTKPHPEHSTSRALLLGDHLPMSTQTQGETFPSMVDQAPGSWSVTERAHDSKDRNAWTIQLASTELKQRLAHKTVIQKPLFVDSVFNPMATDDPTKYLTRQTKFPNTFVQPSSEEGQSSSYPPSPNIVVAQQTTDIKLHQHVADQKEVTGETAWTDPPGISLSEKFVQQNADTCRDSNGSSEFVQEKFPLRDLVKNCSLLRLVHRYGAAPVSPEEEDFPLAFAIKLHVSLLQAEQLLRTIYRAHNFYCLHVDKRAPDEVYEVISSLGDCFSNVEVIRDRVSVVYSSAAHVWAELKCMAAALASHVTWRYYINLTGEEFPLRTNLEMVRILTMFRGANDIESMIHPPHLRWRVDSEFVISGGGLRRTSTPKTFMFPDFPIRKGSAYGAFTRGFVASLFDDNVARAMLRWFNDTYAPEENVWATINALPWIPGGYSLEVRHELNQHASRAVAWRWDEYRCKGKYLRSVCILTSGDLPWLLKQPQLVANKFKTNWDQRVLDCLEQIIFRRAKSRGVSFDPSYFANLPHVTLYREDRQEQGRDTAHTVEKHAVMRIKQDWLSKYAKDVNFVNITVLTSS